MNLIGFTEIHDRWLGSTRHIGINGRSTRVMHHSTARNTSTDYAKPVPELMHLKFHRNQYKASVASRNQIVVRNERVLRRHSPRPTITTLKLLFYFHFYLLFALLYCVELLSVKCFVRINARLRTTRKLPSPTHFRVPRVISINMQQFIVLRNNCRLFSKFGKRSVSKKKIS